jgi:hypothetical protein
MGDGGPQADDEDFGLPSYLGMARLLLGWGCAALGLLNLAMGISDGRYLVFHLVLLIAGAVLLGVGLLRKRPGPIAWLAGGAVALAGLLISALPRTSAAVCCLAGYDRRHGFPFTLLGERAGHWHLDRLHAVADTFFWACVGMFVLLAVAAVSPVRSSKRPAHERPPATARHAEPRPATVDDENVRGLP